MSKEKIIYVCSHCDAQFSKWSGQCMECGKWNTLHEEIAIQNLASLPKSSKIMHKISTEKKEISSPKQQEQKDIRIKTGISEFDRTIGDGFFPDSLTLLTGDPGIGKSTLSLQVAIGVAKNLEKKEVIIISGEESESQISDRIFRLEKDVPPNLKILSECVFELILDQLKNRDIGFLVFDSVQTLVSLDITSSAGSLSQTVAVVERIMHFTKSKKIPTLLIGHVTKTGEMAGPQTLAHLVDTTLHLEGERFHEFRILRSTKNRFGSVFEMGVFEMDEKGLKEVPNPSENFLSGRLQNAIGSAIFPVVEGTRSFLVEVQALTKYTNFGYPKRSASGFDTNRLGILIAVLSRHARVNLESEDVFANIVGGMKISDPAGDLPLIAAILSSKKKIPLPEKTVFCGEVGLSGEVRSVSYLEKRLREAEKLGFTKAFIPAQKKKFSFKTLEVMEIKTVLEMMDYAF